MAGPVESYKKIYENKKAHIFLIIISIIWTLLSTFVDIKTGKTYSYKQNPVDLIFNIIIGAYSLQFLHNAINNINNGVLPSFKDITPRIYLGIIKLNIVWGIYACLCIILAVVTYMTTHFIVLPVIISIALIFCAVFVYYIFLAYAENLDSKGLINILLLFKFIKPAFKPTYLKLILFVIFSLAVAAVYILIYLAAGLTGIDKMVRITNEYYLLDFFMSTFAGYFTIVTWYFAFPYSLIDSYNKYIRPVIRKDNNNVTND